MATARGCLRVELVADVATAQVSWAAQVQQQELLAGCGAALAAVRVVADVEVPRLVLVVIRAPLVKAAVPVRGVAGWAQGLKQGCRAAKVAAGRLLAALVAVLQAGLEAACLLLGPAAAEVADQAEAEP